MASSYLPAGQFPNRQPETREQPTSARQRLLTSPGGTTPPSELRRPGRGTQQWGPLCPLSPWDQLIGCQGRGGHSSEGPPSTGSLPAYTCAVDALSSFLLRTSLSFESSGSVGMATGYLGRGRAGFQIHGPVSAGQPPGPLPPGRPGVVVDSACFCPPLPQRSAQAWAPSLHSRSACSQRAGEFPPTFLKAQSLLGHSTLCGPRRVGRGTAPLSTAPLHPVPSCVPRDTPCQGPSPSHLFQTPPHLFPETHAPGQGTSLMSVKGV